MSRSEGLVLTSCAVPSVEPRCDHKPGGGLGLYPMKNDLSECRGLYRAFPDSEICGRGVEGSAAGRRTPVIWGRSRTSGKRVNSSSLCSSLRRHQIMNPTAIVFPPWLHPPFTLLLTVLRVSPAGGNLWLGREQSSQLSMSVTFRNLGYVTFHLFGERATFPKRYTSSPYPPAKMRTISERTWTLYKCQHLP